jgi:CheY-like chemotaxis protein
VAGLHRILIVEDNYELRNLYEMYLTDHGYEIFTAIDGQDALDKAKTYKPDLIFLDIMMPKIDGLDVLKILRHDETYNCTRAKIVILTNLGDSDRLNDDLRKDMDGYVIKAEIVLDDLISVIRSLDTPNPVTPS